LYASPNISMKKLRVRWAEYVTCIGEMNTKF